MVNGLEPVKLQQWQNREVPKSSSSKRVSLLVLTAVIFGAFALYNNRNILNGIPNATYSDPSTVSTTRGKKYISYSTVSELFLQDLDSTDAATFDYTSSNFGLLNRTYPREQQSELYLPQWARFDRYLGRLNAESGPNVDYKLLFIGRHGQGFHNVAEDYYGTPAWNCYWAQANGNGSIEWADAHLTGTGLQQAQAANNYWARLLVEQDIRPPETFYVSPLYRCLQTAQATYGYLTLPHAHPFIPRIKELLREGISIHTCDRRSTRTVIHHDFPGSVLDRDFSEVDPLWSGVTAETPSAQDYRTRTLLDEIFSSDRSSILSFTTHSGEMASLLRVLKHIPFAVGTGQILPVLVQAEIHFKTPKSTTTEPWTSSAWCTNGPPVTSAQACTCRNSVQPSAVSHGEVSALPVA